LSRLVSSCEKAWLSIVITSMTDRFCDYCLQ
jgi:hypothetical protein